MKTPDQPPHKDAQYLTDKLARTAHEPGVYLLKDGQGTIIYIGKARDLRKRLAAYLKNSGQMDMKTGVLVKKIADFETILTGNEKEALILESNLIKRHRPRYNVVLKDDKRYPSLRLDLQEEYPSFTIVRKIGQDDANYFGPFASAHAVRETLKTINKTFKLRKCRAKDFKTRTRPCLHCQMEGCLAPCCLDVDPEVYREQVNEAIMFLNGRTQDLIAKIKKQMDTASRAQEFEKAARLRDKMFSLQRTIEKQIAVTTDFQNRDVFAIARFDGHTLVMVLNVVAGFIKGKRHFSFEETISTDAEAMGMFVRQYYDKARPLPAEILVSLELPDARLIEAWFKSVKKKKVRILNPKRGEKAKLLAMALRNAENELKGLLAARSAEIELLQRLRKKLGLSRLPQRIECFDNSNISGSQPVAGMVVFEKGKPNKSAYRKFKINAVPRQDDYAYMVEVLSRRLGKLDSQHPSEPSPDLLMVDGGRGQLGVALAVIQDLNLADQFDLIAIAKKDEKKGQPQDKIFKPQRTNPVTFGKDSDLLLFLQRIRDEAHRFAISFHRKSRTKVALRSELDAIAGVGQKRKAILLKHFKSIRKIRQAGIDQLAALPGISSSTAKAIHHYFKLKSE
ncbi:MAG: excinuclease ABC subunit UvrC [Desulfobacterales bacterium]|nr:excinuclease ABC subunit UvrC [Desulfobacterales bacterium]